MIVLSRNASGRLNCHFDDKISSKEVTDYLKNELGFIADTPIHDPAFTQLYQDYNKENHRVVYGFDDWFEGFFLFAWNEESDFYIQLIFDKFQS